MNDTGPGRRAWLFVPGHRPSRFDRARSSGAAAVICDLEDAVPDDQKAEARHNIRSWLDSGGTALVRINGVGTPWHEQDVVELAGAAGLKGWVLPKVEKAEDVAALAGTATGQQLVMPIIESAVAVERLESILCHRLIGRAVLGSVDLAADLGVEHSSPLLDHVRARVVIASRAARRQAPIDGVTTGFSDPRRTEADSRNARRAGFGGKLAIHPDQVGPIERGFRPHPDEVAWARAVIDGADRGGRGAFSVDGAMVDAPVIIRARQILADAAGTEQEDESR